MENLNHTLFLWLNAPQHPNPLILAIAIFFAECLIWVLPIIIGFGWLRGGERARKILIEGTISGLAGLLINQVIGLVWQHPRPFMIGIGHTLIPHAADSSFPSDHVTLLWAIAFSFMMHRSARLLGIALALLGLPLAWARIYLGVHFPLDMLGAALVAILSAWLAFRGERLYLPTAYHLALHLYRLLFWPLIQMGWVNK